MTNNINLCLEFCKGIPSGDEARQLARDYKAGDQSARDRLITGNLPMVSRLIRSFRAPENLMDDAFSEGALGLMHAVEVYDPDDPRGAGFSTVAYWWVMHKIQALLKREVRHHERETTVGFDIEIECEHDFTTDVDTLPPMLLASLSRRERLALKNVTEDVKMSEIAVEMGVTRERVRQIRNRAIDKLRGVVR